MKASIGVQRPALAVGIKLFRYGVGRPIGFNDHQSREFAAVEASGLALSEGRARPSRPSGGSRRRRRGAATSAQHLGGLRPSSRDGLNQQTLVGFPRFDGRPRLSTRAQALSAIEPQASFELGGGCGVAAVAVLDQHGPDLRLEEGHTRRAVRRVPRARSGPGTRGTTNGEGIAWAGTLRGPKVGVGVVFHSADPGRVGLSTPSS